jgi:hypothetical protein
MPRMTSSDYMQAAQAARMRSVGTGQRAQLAEMGAAQLEQYGAEGQQWAQRLRQNPQAALAMAQQYGGFAKIEQGFKYAAANGRNATADTLARMALEGPGGAAAFGQVASGQGRLDVGKAQLSDAAVSRLASDMVWGGYEPGSQGSGGGEGTQTGKGMRADLEYRMALASGDPKKARDARDRMNAMRRTPEQQLEFLKRTDPTKANQFRENMQSITDTQITALASERAKKAAGVASVFEVGTKISKMTDFEDPNWEFSIAVELNKALQPDSAVLLSEAQVLYDNLTDKMSEVGRMVQGVWTPTGRLDADGRRKLWNMTMDLVNAGMQEYKDTNASWKEQNDDVYNFKPANDLITRPGSEYLGRIDEFLARERPKLEESTVPNGVTGTHTDPITGATTKMIMTNGKWGPVK